MASREINGAAVAREYLIKSRFEARFADLESAEDISAITAIFNQERVLPHLSGMAPKETPPEIDIKRYARNRPEYNALIATEEEIQKYYQDRPNSYLIVGLDKRDSRVTGTVTVDGPVGSGLGILYAGISRLGVLDAKREGLGRYLVWCAKAFIFSKKSDGGLESTAAQAGVILGVKDKDLPLNLFESEGFENKGDLHRQCVSWDYDINRFALRDVRILRREAQSPPKKGEHKIDVSEIPQRIK